MDERDPGLLADHPELLLVHNPVSHTAAPFDDESEGHPWLGVQRRTGPPGLARTHPVHAAERPRKGFSRAVAVAHRDVQQRPLTGEHLGARHGQPPAPDVLRQRDARQRGEQPTEVVLRRHRDAREMSHLDRPVEMRLDVLHGLVEPLQHSGPPSLSTITLGSSGPAAPDILCPA
ncbi:hypothetical protein BKA18_004226 [Streptomyces auratus]